MIDNLLSLFFLLSLNFLDQSKITSGPCHSGSNGLIRGDQKVLQFDLTHKWHQQKFYFVIQHNRPNSITYDIVTLIKKLFDDSQTEFLLHALQVRLRGLLDLAVIVELCFCCAGCSNGHWTLDCHIHLTHQTWHPWLLPISSSEEVVPRWQWDQTIHWVLSRIWTVTKKQRKRIGRWGKR